MLDPDEQAYQHELRMKRAKKRREQASKPERWALGYIKRAEAMKEKPKIPHAPCVHSRQNAIILATWAQAHKSLFDDYVTHPTKGLLKSVTKRLFKKQSHITDPQFDNLYLCCVRVGFDTNLLE